MNKFEEVGKYWNDGDIKIISNKTDYFALNNWNGEAWTDCWRVLDKKGLEKANDNTIYEITPILEEVEDGFIIVDYDIRQI